jgi:hypothetical protein
MQNTGTQGPHARTTSRTAPTIAHCAIITACTPPRARHTARHTAPTTPHAAHGKSHPVTHAAFATHSRQSCQAAQRRRDAAGELVVVQPQHPAGHTNSHRHTMAPDAAADPSQPPATHLSSSHSINQVKSNERQSAHCIIAHAQHRVRVTPATTQPDSPQVLDAVIPLDNAATLRRSRTSQRDTQRRYPRANKRSAQQQHSNCK